MSHEAGTVRAGRSQVASPQALVSDLVFGRWRSQILHAGVGLGVFEALAPAESKSADAIAESLGLDVTMAYRLLRALGGIGVLEELPGRRFALSEAGKLLRAEHPQSLRGILLLVEGPEHTAIWKHLMAIVRDGKQDGFVREYGRTAFEHAAKEPSYAEAFDQGMTARSTMQTPWVLDALRDVDFTSVRHLCDVGGGRGHLLCHFLVRYPHLKGTVLERAGAIENRQALLAERMNVADRCQYVAGDMFEDVPPADAYLLKMILHDWNDEECVRILQALHRRASPGGRVFVAEHVIRASDDFAKLLDINMMCWGPGRERSAEEYAALLQRAGWRYVDTHFPSQGAMGVVEGAKSDEAAHERT